MTDDIVEELRAAARRERGWRFWSNYYLRAADEIERLRAENAALHEAFRQSMWHDTLIPIAEALGVSIVDEHGENRRQFQMVEAIIEEALGD
jgi:signal transduction histidine kinase